MTRPRPNRRFLRKAAFLALLAPFAYAADEAEKTPEPDPSATPCFFCFYKENGLEKTELSAILELNYKLDEV